jgi:hypothetical protein
MPGMNGTSGLNQRSGRSHTSPVPVPCFSGLPGSFSNHRSSRGVEHSGHRLETTDKTR